MTRTNEEIDGYEFGPCCACGLAGPTVRNIVALPQKAPIPGTGWGCVVCGLALDGAVAVMCDRCLEEEAELRYACFGRAERVPLSELVGRHDHDLEKHPELKRRCRVCGCTQLAACVSEEHGPCWWVAEDLCWHCAMQEAGGLPV